MPHFYLNFASLDIPWEPKRPYVLVSPWGEATQQRCNSGNLLSGLLPAWLLLCGTNQRSIEARRRLEWFGWQAAFWQVVLVLVPITVEKSVETTHLFCKSALWDNLGEERRHTTWAAWTTGTDRSPAYAVVVQQQTPQWLVAKTKS